MQSNASVPELIAALTLVITIATFTSVAWLKLLQTGPRISAIQRMISVTGPLILTALVLTGGMLFLLPPWVVPDHEGLGVAWFFSCPACLLLSFGCGIAGWRINGRAVVAASLAGLTLWTLVATSVKI
jgi:hypothetical protein